MTRTRLPLLTATTALGLGLAVLAPAAAATAAPHAAPDASGVSADMTMWGESTWYGSGQFVVANHSDAPADWSLTFTVPHGTYQNHSDWNVRAEVHGDRVTLTPKGGDLAAGQSEYVSFGIEGDGTSALQPSGCDLDGAAVGGCSEDGGAPAPSGPSTPGDLRMTGVKANRAIVNWTPATDDGTVVSNTVTVRGADGSVVAEHEVRGGALASTVLNGLARSTTYSVSMHATDDEGNESAESAPVTFTTTAGAAPTTPSDLRVTGVESDRVILNWTPGTDDDFVLGNMISLRDAHGALLRQYPTGGQAISSHILHHLAAGTTYTVSMHTYDSDARDSAESETITFTTAD